MNQTGKQPMKWFQTIPDTDGLKQNTKSNIFLKCLLVYLSI